MRSAHEVLKEERSKLRLTTGSRDLDALIDGVIQGQFYLFYSNDEEILDLLIHRVLVNCVLPVEKGGFDSKAFYFNTCNYHQGKTILDPSKLAMIAKCAGVDPKVVFRNIYAVSAFNEMQQMTVTREATELVKKDEAIRLVAVHNLTRFIQTSRRVPVARQILKQIVGSLKNATSEKAVALVVSCNASRAGRIPKPIGGTYLRHEANVVVLLKSLKKGAMAAIKVTLVKHPYKKTPQSIILHTPKDGVTLMGHVTPSFRKRFQSLVEELKGSDGFQNTLIKLEHKQAFDLLLKEAWSAEDAAMSNSGIPCLMDVLNLIANVHNKKCVEELKKKVVKLERFLKEKEDKRRTSVGGTHQNS